MSHNTEIKGKVINSAGQPIANAVVLIKKGPALYQDIAILTNDEGLFHLQDLASGTYTLRVNKEGFISKVIETKTGVPTRVQIVLEKKGT